MPDGRAIVIDDDAAVLSSLEAMLEVAGFEVQVFRSSREFLAALPNLEPGCVVTDVRMPEISGLALVERLKSGNRSHWPIIVISGPADVPMAVAAMRAGACNFLEKPICPTLLVEAISAAFAARQASPAVSSMDPELKARLAALSRREAEVLTHLLNGASSKVTALVLGISPRTVDVFRGNILRKTGAANIAALATLVARAGGLAEARPGG